MTPSRKRWYVTRTKARQEKRAQENLERMGYFTYCPHITKLRRRRGCWQSATEPLFPRYLFMKMEEGKDDFAPILSTVGISSILRFGNHLASVSQHAIDIIREQEQILTNKNSPFEQGDQVEFVKGPLAGLSGIFDMQCENGRVLVMLQLLGRENSITADLNNIVHA